MLKTIRVGLGLSVLAAAAGVVAPVAVNQARAGTLWCDGAQLHDFAHFDGGGFSPASPGGALDSRWWRVLGASDGDGEFGGVHLGGDFARGRSAGGVSAGGVYAFDVAPAGAAGPDWALGLQATGTDFTPGAVELRLHNDGAMTVDSIRVDYELHARNDGNRSSSVSLTAAVQDAEGALRSVPAAGEPFVTEQDRQAEPGWAAVMRTTLLSGLDLSPGGALLLRWQLADHGGTGARDEIALDDLGLRVVSLVEEPASGVLLAAGLAAGALRRRGLRLRPRPAST